MESPQEAAERRMVVEHRVRHAVSDLLHRRLVTLEERAVRDSGATYLDYMRSVLRCSASPLALWGRS